jgi:hypothetical protein
MRLGPKALDKAKHEEVYMTKTTNEPLTLTLSLR